jgi:hypothetical protein
MNATYEYYFGSYTVKAVYGSHIRETTVDVTKNKQVTLSLPDFLVPEFSLFAIIPLLMFATLLVLVVYRRKFWSIEKT